MTILWVIISAIVLALLALYAYQTWWPFFRKIRKIPGPPALPLVENLFDILFKSTEELFRLELEKALKYYPIYRVLSPNQAVVIMMLPEDIEILLSSTEYNEKSGSYFFLEPWLGKGLLTSDGAKWQKRRKILTPAFHFTILREFVNIFNNEVSKLVKNLDEIIIDEPNIDVIQPITHFALLALTETSMGVKLNLEDAISHNYNQAIHDFGKLFTYRLCRPWLYSDSIYYNLSARGKFQKTVVNNLHDFSRNVIKERKDVNKSKSYSSGKKLAMLDLLLKAQEEGEDLDDEGIREEVDTFIFEGHDTTSIAISAVLLVLANYPEIQEEVYREIVDVLGANALPTYNDLQGLFLTERTIKECLRMFPSVPQFSRKIRKDLKTASGYLIPRGTTIRVNVFGMHRNPNVFPDPENIDPDRFLPENVQRRHRFAYIPFSAGPRNCIGQKFAMLQLKTTLCGISRRFRLEKVDSLEDVKFVADIVLRTKDGIRIKFVPR